MFLEDLLSFKKSIEEARVDMCHLVKNKGIQDPEVIKFSQDLDEKIVNLQRILLDLQLVNIKSHDLTTKMISKQLNKDTNSNFLVRCLC